MRLTPQWISSRDRRRCFMLKWALIFLVVALIAGALGFTGVAGAAASIAKILFWLFIAVCVLLFLAAVFVGKKLF